MKDNNQKNHDVEKVAEPAAPPDTPKEAPGRDLKEAPKEAPKPSVTRFLFISKFALIHDLAWTPSGVQRIDAELRELERLWEA